MKSNSVISAVVSETNITFTVAGQKPLVLEFGAISASVKARAMVHGLTQRVSDAAAISRNPETGLAATPADKRAAMEKIVVHYMSGTDDWSLPRVGGGATSYLFRAMVALYPKNGEEFLRAFLAARSDAEKKALAMEPAIAEKIRDLQPANVDEETVERVSGLLAAL